MKKFGEIGRLWPWAALLVITAGAAVADAWGITRDSLELFYAAGVRSMAGNWHDFLFGGFDPNGLVTLDKLPGPFWVQALSVRIFGLSVWAMVLPQVVYAVLTVVVLFFSVRRAAGRIAGLVAAALFALSPVVLTSARGNLEDPLFVLLAVLMADAMLRAVDTGAIRWLLLAALWTGLAFQAKMAEAWLLAGILGVVYLACGPVSPGFFGGLWRRAGGLLLAAPVLAVVSLGWMVFVALTPAANRPYADGSAHNSVFEQVFVYNGLVRFGNGSAQLFGLGYPVKPSAGSLAYLRESEAAYSTAVQLSQASPVRLLTAPVAQLTGWLLLPAVVIAVAAVVAVVRARGARRRRRLAPALAWGLWLLAMVIVFSASRFVQAYYFAVLAPAIAALCALVAARLARLSVRAGDSPEGRKWRLMLAVGLTVAALASAGVLAEAGGAWLWAGIAAGGAALAAGVVAIVLAEAGTGRVTGRVLLAVTIAAGLAGPVLADGWAFARHASPFDPLLSSSGTFAEPSPSALAARRAYPGYGGAIAPEMTPSLWNRVQQVGRDQDRLAPHQWIAVYSSAEASEYILGGARDILPVGGYAGVVPSPAASYLTWMISHGEILYAIIPGPDDIRRNDPRVQAVVRRCHLSSFASENVGAAAGGPQVWDCGRSAA